MPTLDRAPPRLRTAGGSRLGPGVAPSGARRARGGALGRDRVGRLARSAFDDARFSMPDLPAWRMRREHGGGALIDKAIHHLDLWSYLLDDRIDEVFAFGHAGRGDDETVAVSARMRGGALATLQASDDTVTRNELTLNGDLGSVRIDLYRSDGLELVGLGDLPGAPRPGCAERSRTPGRPSRMPARSAAAAPSMRPTAPSGRRLPVASGASSRRRARRGRSPRAPGGAGRGTFDHGRSGRPRGRCSIGAGPPT